MLTIVGLLKGWESAVEEVQERSPPAVRPVIDRVLGEIGGLRDCCPRTLVSGSRTIWRPRLRIRDAAALSAGTAGALDRVPLEMGVFGLFCLLNIFELALVPTTFLNLGLIEVVEDFVRRSEDNTPYAIDAPK